MQKDYRLQSKKDGICILEIDELHQKAGGSFSYTVCLNQVPVHQRTMEPLSDRIFPYFVKLNTKSDDVITISFDSDTTVSFQNVYLHEDLEQIKQIYLEPMEMGLCFPRFTYTDQEKDFALMQQIKQDFAGLTHFTIAIGIEITYMLNNDAQLEEQFHYILTLAEKVGVNLLFNFNSWWDGTPNGRDGKGGYFNDVEYQQVVYDPISGKKILSIPNLWRNIPWYTMNHEHLNFVRKERLKSTLDLLMKIAAYHRAQDRCVPEYRIFIDNEPTYWAEYAYTASPECGGDFNEFCITAAKKDGVDLEPNGNLTSAQKEWLFQNLSTYMTDISSAYCEQSAKEYGVITSDGIIYGNHHLSENIFTHTMAYSGFPYADGEHLRYETHINPYTRLGVECHGHQDERVLSYINGTGRFAQVNAERCCYTDSVFHRQFYAHGAVCDIIFNCFYDSDKDVIRQLDDMTDCYLTTEEYGTPVMTYRVYDGNIVGGSIVEHMNIEVAPLRERRVLRPKELGKGSITFTIGTAEHFIHGGWVELTGLVRPTNGSITVSIGTDRKNLSFVYPLPERDADFAEIPYRISLSDVLSTIIDMNSTLYLRLDFESLFYDDWAQMNAIWKIRSVAAFEQTAEDKAIPITLEESRALSLMVSYRTDCTRLLQEYPCLSEALIKESLYKESLFKKHLFKKQLSKKQLSKKHLSDISTKKFLFNADAIHYKDLYKDFMHKISVANTDKFINHGEEYPVASQNSAVNTLNQTPVEIIGTFLDYDANHDKIKITTHNNRQWNWQPTLEFFCKENVPVTIKASELAGNMLDHISSNPYTPAAILNARIDAEPTLLSLNRGDMVTLTLHENAITDIHVVRGLVRGKILDIVPVSLSAPMHNAFLTIEMAPGVQETFELGMQTHLNYERAHADNPILAGELDLELKKDSIVLISFEPERVGERAYRALEVTIV